MFLVPFAISFNILTSKGFFFCIIFILILALGIFYEWKYKAIDWSESK